MLELDPDGEWSQEGPMLSNDIWKKFELIPTPPRSPLRDQDLDMYSPFSSPFPGTNLKDHHNAFDLGGVVGSTFGPLSSGPLGQDAFDHIPDFPDLSQLADMPLMEGDEDLFVDLESIDLDAHLTPFQVPDSGTGGGGVSCCHGLDRGSCTSCTQLALAGSELRHDCMWVGTCTADAHSHNLYPRTHKDSCSSVSYVTELLKGCSSSFCALESTGDFTKMMTDFHGDTESTTHLDDVDDSCLHLARPDTPSESSETDTDDDHRYDDDEEEESVQQRHQYGAGKRLDILSQQQGGGDDDDDDDDEDDDEDDDYTPSGTPHSSQDIVHVDHSYHCVRIPSPLPSSSASSTTSSYLHTPSDSEDEIDVVSVGSPDSAYSSSSSRSNSSRSKPKQKGTNVVTTTTTNVGLKKIVKIRASSLPTKPSRRVRKQLQQAVTEGVKRRGGDGGVGAGKVLLVRKTGGNGAASSHLKTPKRLQRNQTPRKKKSQRIDTDDPSKRDMHNTLERMRRVDLRNAFEELRTLVPSLTDRDKAPKVEILKRAADYCQTITQEGARLEQEKEKERRSHNELRRKLLSLQRQLR